MSEKMLDFNTTPVKVFLYFTGTWKVFVHKILLNLPFFALTLRLTNRVLYYFSETSFGSSILSYVYLDIPGYSLVKADHPAHTEGSKICIYFPKSLPLTI